MPPGLPPTSGTRDLSRRTGRGPDAGLKFHAAGLGCVALRTEVRVPIVGIGHGGAGAIPECARWRDSGAVGFLPGGSAAERNGTKPALATRRGRNQRLLPPALLSCHIMPNDMLSATTRTSVVM